MQQQSIPINPTLLQWARMEAGLSLHEAAMRAKVTAPRKRKDEPELTPEDRLAAWEQGTDTPSLNQLENIASAYRRPLLTFFLPGPPKKIEAFADFRTVASHLSAADSPEFAALKRKLTLFHQTLRGLAEEEGGKKLSFIASLSADTPVQQFVENIRATLGVHFADQRRIRDEDAMLGYLRSSAQKAGIFVVFEGNMGSHHSNIPPEVFRGIALADELVPLIVVNPNDAKAAMVFTLIHELAHLWLGASGISNFSAWGNHGGHGNHEQLCNHVAAEFLVPQIELRAMWKTPEGSLSQAVDSIAKFFKVSGAVVSRRLLDIDMIDSQEYGSLLAFYNARWAKRKEAQALKDGAPGPKQKAQYRLGEKTIHTFISAAREGRIGLQDAARSMNIPVSLFGQVQR